MRFVNGIKKFIIVLAAAITVFFFYIPTLRAQQAGPGGSAETYLYHIMENTYGILQDFNNFPNYLEGLGKFIISWMTNDTSETTTSMQGNFATLGSLIVSDQDAQKSAQLDLTADLYNQTNKGVFVNPPGSPAILDTIPNINGLTYSTVLGLPPVKNIPKALQNQNTPYNYIKNAGGMTLVHTQPGLTWQGPADDQTKYQNYYNTMMSIESFNGYILSNLFAETQNGNAFTKTQNALISQASNSSWVAEIATEELGKVLRQILMFESQSYVLLSQSVQTQKQMLTAQAMTNALLIMANQTSETLLVSKAQGVRPQG